MCEMWAIYSQSWPSSNWQQCSSDGHFLIVRHERESESLSFVKYWSFEQLEICNFSSELRCLRPASVKDSTSGQLLIDNVVREVSC